MVVALWLVQWILGALWPLTLISAGDSDSGPSALGVLGLPEPIAGALGGVSIVGFFLALVAGIVALVAAGASRPDAALPHTPET